MFYDNFLKACNMVGKAPTTVLQEAGISKSANTRWQNGEKPTPANVLKLSEYFGILKTDLTGETYLKLTGPVTPTPASSELQRLSNALEELNEEGREKLLDYAADLVASGRYKKADPAGLGQKA